MTAMRAAVIVLAMLSLAACTAREGERTLTKFSKSREPEEFSILPRKPLSLPPSMRDLPAPDTSTGNRSDQTPLSDAVSALGGRATADGARPTSDSALIAAVEMVYVEWPSSARSVVSVLREALNAVTCYRYVFKI